MARRDLHRWVAPRRAHLLDPGIGSGESGPPLLRQESRQSRLWSNPTPGAMNCARAFGAIVNDSGWIHCRRIGSQSYAPMNRCKDDN